MAIMYTNFEEYFIQGEPNKKEKAEAWTIAIGLQAVDGLKPSEYLIEIAKANIEGNINIEEARQKIHSYYETVSPSIKNDGTEEADKVATRIIELLNEQSFSFSPLEYISIHKRLFQDIYDFAGEIRSKNISKKEWVLNGESVLYGNAFLLRETLEYDFKEEKHFNYKGLSTKEVIEHIANFISSVWQNHIFGEGNTRATAIFLIKYLRKLGYKSIDNTLFAEHSWYFRNALVRANYEDLSKGIYKSNEYLICFLSNLLLHTKHSLQERNCNSPLL